MAALIRHTVSESKKKSLAKYTLYFDCSHWH